AEPWPTAELFFEYAGGGSLHSILKGGSGLPGSLALRLAGQVLSALEHCHRCGIAHRDVKGANVLLFPHGIAKLADFGSSKVVNTLPRSPGSHATSPTGDGSARAATPRCQGTIAWMAPELMQETGAPCDAYKADVWSFGCLCVELLTGGPPWKAHRGVGEMMMAISATPASDVLPPDLPAAWREAILSCLQHDPSARPSTSQLLQLPLFGGHVDEDRGESGTLGGPRASPRVPEPLAYLLRDWLADTTYRMRVSRVLDLLAQGTEEALPSARSGPRSARSRNVLWAGEVPRLSLTDVRRVALLMRGRLQSTAYVVDDVLWGLQELWPVWGSEGDLLLQGLPPARHDGGAQLEQLQQSPAMTQDDEGYEVVNEDAEGVYVPSQLHAGMLLQWLHAARQSLADQRLAGGHPGQSSVCTVMDRHAAVYRSWRHAHQLSMAVLEVQSGLQGILLACSAASKHADSAEDSGQVDLEQMLASLGRAAVATVNRSMLLHNAACTLHQGMWQRDFRVATGGDPAPETEEGEAATWEGGWYEDEWGDASGELGDSLAVEEGAEATQDEPGTGLVAMALADYHPATDTELAFQEGDLIIVHTQHESGWWEGDCNGETGWFPSNH
ncbi:ANP2, partial [Symbiodinium sp. KB8]